MSEPRICVLLVYNREMPYGDCVDITYQVDGVPQLFQSRNCKKLKKVMADICRSWVVSDLRILPVTLPEGAP